MSSGTIRSGRAADEILMSTSSDGGLTWGAATPTANLAQGIGGQPLVQPNGTVVVPIELTNSPIMASFSSIDGGASWSAPVTIANIQLHPRCGRNSQRAAALGCGGWSRNDLGGVGGLPLSNRLLYQ